MLSGRSKFAGDESIFLILAKARSQMPAVLEIASTGAASGCRAYCRLTTLRGAVPVNPNRIVRARVPLWLGLAGGGTDLSPYCDQYGGAVLNVTIDRYAYAFIEPVNDGRLHFAAPDLEAEEDLPLDLAALETAKLQLHAGVTRRMLRQFAHGAVPSVRVVSCVDAPPGSGLGSSSALVVALVEAFTHLLWAPLGPYDVAHLAFEVERVELGLAGGRQDQYAATFGGANFMEFHAADRVIVNPLRVAPWIRHRRRGRRRGTRHREQAVQQHG
jgi:D-glycero-alpha-D-manno-heptose-7-phosphate kinase